MPGFPVHHQLPDLLKLMSIKSVMPSNHLIFCRLLLFPPSVFPSIRIFFSESVLCIRWQKYWSFSISPSNEYSGLIPFRIDWLDLAIQGTLKSLLQHHSSKASILWCSAFFMVPLSHPYKESNQGLLHCRQILYQLSCGLPLTITPVLWLFWNVVLLISKFLSHI